MKYMTDKTAKRFTGCLASFAILSAGTAFAGDSTSDKQSMSKKGEDYENTAKTARSVEGMDFDFENGDSAGVVDDFVISTDSGSIEGFVVGTGFLGLGGPEHYVSFSKLSETDYDSSSLSSTLSESELTKQPVFLSDRLETSRDGKTNIQSGEFAAMDLVGSDVYNKDGSYHGEVHDWIVDVQSGNVPYVIVRRLEPATGFSSTNYDYFAVSTSALEGVRGDDLIVSASNDEFASAEYIDNDTSLKKASDSSVHAFRYNAGDA